MPSSPWGAALAAALLLSVPIASCAQQTAQGGAVVTAPSAVTTRADTGALRRTLDSLAEAHRGIVGYAVHNLETGERLSRRGDETFPTASLIKVPILVTVFDLVEKRRLALDDRLTVLRIDKVPGSGILQHLHDGAEITVQDAAWLMITLSDNTATNLLLDRIIIRRVWETMEALGLMNTKPHSKTFLRNSSVAMDSSVKYGIGVTTPNEMARLYAMMAEGKAVSAAADSAMLRIMEHTTDDQLLQRYVSGARAAHKTGATNSVRTECTLWRLPARVVACVLTKDNEDTRWVMDSEPQLTMARMGEAIANAWRAREAAAAP
ncbi:MAG TPA: serine hydrolase [Gemmatimonadaceae bacterium]|nr:serine hydrolase [Gemmatimonadaceae bacterium]